MYNFRIVKQDTGGYRFELKGIKLLVDDYQLTDNSHILRNPQKAIAYFDLGDSIYGVSNSLVSYQTAEAFYDAINQQYHLFTDDNAAVH